MKGAAWFLAGALVLGWAGCHCEGHHSNGMYDTADGVLAQQAAVFDTPGPPETAEAVAIRAAAAQAAEQPTAATQTQTAQAAPAEAPTVYGYVPDAGSADVMNAAAAESTDTQLPPADVIKDTADPQFEAAYTELMSVMDVEDIGTRSTHRIIK